MACVDLIEMGLLSHEWYLRYISCGSFSHEAKSRHHSAMQTDMGYECPVVGLNTRVPTALCKLIVGLAHGKRGGERGAGRQSTHASANVWQTVLEQGGQFAGINRKVQLKPVRWSHPGDADSAEPPRILEAILILKHGGVLTHAGREQVRLPVTSHLLLTKLHHHTAGTLCTAHSPILKSAPACPNGSECMPLHS